MVESYSPTGEEEEIANFISEELEKLGFRVDRDKVGNVIGRLGKGRPRVLLCGHMDTIPGLIPVKLEDGVLYGRGAADAKAPLASMIIASAQLHAEKFEEGILLAAVVGEEGQSLGVRNLIQEGINVDYAIFGEPSGVDGITIGYRGSLHFKIRCETEAGHSSSPWLFWSAVEAAIEIWELIKNLRMPQENPKSRFHSISSCIKRMVGGDDGSVVPSWCDMHIDVRIPPKLTVVLVKEEIDRILETYRAENPAVELTFEVEDYTEPYLGNSKSPLVRALSRAIWKVRRSQVVLKKKTGTGDMNLFGVSTGIPVVTYGPGDSHLEHTPKEHIRLDDYLDGIKVLKEALRLLFELEN